MGNRTSLARSGIIVALAVVLAGCAQSPAEAPTPTGAPTSTSTPEASATPSSDVVAVVAGPEAFSLVDATGTALESFDYDRPSGAARAALATLFGADPLVNDYSSGKIPSYSYEWEGVRLADPLGEGSEFSPDWSIIFTAASLGEITFRSVEGTVVGEPAAAVWDRYPDHPEQVDAAGNRHFSISVEETSIGTDDQGNDRTYSVFISAESPDGPITSIAAPYTNFGD